VSVGQDFSEDIWIGEGRTVDLEVLLPGRSMPRVPDGWPY
jgi:hypothetical protein